MDQLVKIRTTTKHARGSRWSVALLLMAGVFIHAGPLSARSAPDSFAGLVEKLLPAVVNISTSQKVSRKGGHGFPDFDLPPGSPFRDFFDQFKKHREDQPESNGKATSLGSGFIIDKSGLIVTNNHVIDGADQITVVMKDSTRLEAKVLGKDEKTDLALLKVTSKKPLPFLKWGDSRKARVGDWVLAIGNPLGLGGSVTAGIVSARGRDIRSGPYDDFIQTDAPINRGNSGGPLFDMQGNVIGINTAILSPNGGSIGIGFSIPSQLAKGVIGQLQKFGVTKRGWLGVQIQTVSGFGSICGMNQAAAEVVCKQLVAAAALPGGACLASSRARGASVTIPKAAPGTERWGAGGGGCLEANRSSAPSSSLTGSQTSSTTGCTTPTSGD